MTATIEINDIKGIDIFKHIQSLPITNEAKRTAANFYRAAIQCRWTPKNADISVIASADGGAQIICHHKGRRTSMHIDPSGDKLRVYSVDEKSKTSRYEWQSWQFANLESEMYWMFQMRKWSHQLKHEPWKIVRIIAGVGGLILTGIITYMLLK